MLCLSQFVYYFRKSYYLKNDRYYLTFILAHHDPLALLFAMRWKKKKTGCRGNQVQEEINDYVEFSR